MITVGVCMGCGRRLERGVVDISCLEDEVPRFVAGMWEACCGWPVQTSGRLFRPYTVPVPTPEDLLRGAGLSVGWP